MAWVGRMNNIRACAEELDSKRDCLCVECRVDFLAALMVLIYRKTERTFVKER